MRAAIILASIVALPPLAQAGIIPAAKRNSNDDPILVVPSNSSNGPVMMVPEGTPDGVYNIWLDEAGEVVVEQLRSLLELPSGNELLQARNKYDCTHVTLVSNNIQRAAYNLGQTCNDNVKVKPRGSLTSISGSVVVYACNDARYTTHYCRSDTINSVVSFLEDKCPSYRAGEYTFSKNQDPNGNGVRTYGYTAKGNGICYGQTA